MTRTIIIQADDPRVSALAERLRLAAIGGQLSAIAEANIREEMEALAVDPRALIALEETGHAYDFGQLHRGNFHQLYGDIHPRIGCSIGIDHAAQPSYTPPIHPLDRACPTCKSPVGSRCVGRTGRHRDVHPARKIK